MGQELSKTMQVQACCADRRDGDEDSDSAGIFSRYVRDSVNDPRSTAFAAQGEWHERKGEGNGLLGLGLKPRKEPPRELGLDTTLAGTTAAGQAGPVAPGEWDAPVGGEWEDGQDDVAAAFAAAGVRPHRRSGGGGESPLAALAAMRRREQGAAGASGTLSAHGSHDVPSKGDASFAAPANLHNMTKEQRKMWNEAQARKRAAGNVKIEAGKAGHRTEERQKRKAASTTIHSAEYELRETERELYVMWKQQAGQFSKFRPSQNGVTEAEHRYHTDLKIKNLVTFNRNLQREVHERRIPTDGISPVSYSGAERQFAVRLSPGKKALIPAVVGHKSDLQHISTLDYMDLKDPELRRTEHGHMSFATRLTADEVRELRKKLLHHKDGHHDAMDEVHEESSLDKDLVMYNMYRKDRKMQRAIVEHRLRTEKGFDGLPKEQMEREVDKAIAAYEKTLRGVARASVSRKDGAHGDGLSSSLDEDSEDVDQAASAGIGEQHALLASLGIPFLSPKTREGSAADK